MSQKDKDNDNAIDKDKIEAAKLASKKETKIEIATSRVKIIQSIKFFASNEYLDYKKNEIVKVSLKVKEILINRGVAIAL